jgi:hypothetical protein
MHLGHRADAGGMDPDVAEPQLVEQAGHVGEFAAESAKRDLLVAQENRILKPTDFSPVQ